MSSKFFQWISRGENSTALTVAAILFGSTKMRSGTVLVARSQTITMVQGSSHVELHLGCHDLQMHDLQMQSGTFPTDTGFEMHTNFQRNQ